MAPLTTPTLDFLWVAGTPTTNEQFDTNSVFCVNETLDTLPHSSLLKNTTLTLQLPDQICNSPYCQPYNSYNVSSDNLVLDQLILPELIIDNDVPANWLSLMSSEFREHTRGKVINFSVTNNRELAYGSQFTLSTQLITLN